MIPKVIFDRAMEIYRRRRTTRSGLCLKVVILAVLTVPITAQKPDDFSVSVPDAPITAWSGSSVSLPCELSPLFNAEPLEVRWYRPDNSYSPALLYEDHKIQEAPVDPRYRGRVSLTGGMERGNVSLTLERVTVEDSGEYVCRVSSEQWFDKASVFLTVNVLGGIPVLSVAEAREGGGQVNITCLSEGWSPQPTVTWTNKEGTEIRNEQEVLNTSDPQGLVSVSSWLLYAPSYSDWLACTVSLSEEMKREGRILPHIYTGPTAVPGVSEEAFIVTLVLLVLSLVIICALCSVILWKRRGSMWCSSQKSRNRSDQTELGQRPAETKNLIEVAENTLTTPTEQRAAGKQVNLKGAKNTVPRPTVQRAAGKQVNLKGAENTVPRHTDQRAAGKEVNLKGAENTVPKSTEQRADGKKVKLKGAENTVSRPTEQRAAGKQVKLNGAENTVPRPTERRASGKQVNLKVLPKCAPLGAENTVPRPTEKRAAGKQVNLKGAPLGAENTLPTPTEQRAAGKQVHLEAENNNSIERAENTVKTPTEHISSGKEVNLKDWHQVKGFKGEENSVPTPTEQRAAGKQVNLEVAENTVPTPTDQRAAEEEVNLKGAENTVPTPTEQRAAGKQVNLEGAENTVKIPTEHISSGKEVNLKDWHQVKGFKENIILDEKTAHPVIRVNRGNQAHYVKEKDTENASIRMHLHVFSKESFSSGQHYWEVKVKERTTGKLSWYVGVASENVERNCNVPLTPQNGFWILSFDKEKCFHVNTDPQSPITVEELTIVGVFLDCDRHTLSFYNVDTESPLYTFTDVKTSNYFPVLSPGQHDKTPIRIN